MSITCRAPHSAGRCHHLHEQVKIRAIRDDNVEITADQRDDTGDLNDDGIETRDSVNDMLNEINNAENIGRPEPSEKNDNSEKESEFTRIRSILCSRKK